MKIYSLIIIFIFHAIPALGSNSINSLPKIMVIIPEYHIHHEVREPVQQEIPDPAGETEIIAAFIKAGYPVVDPAISDKIKKNEQLRANLSENDQLAAEIGMKFGADIIITGEAFSENIAQVISGFQSCRARLEAKAVSTANAQIIAADSTYASGADITEHTAGKKALQKAGEKMSRKIISQLKINWTNQGKKPDNYIVSFSKVSFSSLNNIESAMRNSSTKIKNISLLTFNKNIASYEISCLLSIRELAEAIITSQKNHKIELLNLSETQLSFSYKDL